MGDEAARRADRVLVPAAGRASRPGRRCAAATTLSVSGPTSASIGRAERDERPRVEAALERQVPGDHRRPASARTRGRRRPARRRRRASAASVASYDAERCPTSSSTAGREVERLGGVGRRSSCPRRRRRTAASRRASCTSRRGCAPRRCRPRGSAAAAAARVAGAATCAGCRDRPHPHVRPAPPLSRSPRSIGAASRAPARLRASAYAQTAADRRRRTSPHGSPVSVPCRTSSDGHIRLYSNCFAPRLPHRRRDTSRRVSARRRSMRAAASKSPAKTAAACAALSSAISYIAAAARSRSATPCVRVFGLGQPPVEHEGGVRGIPPRPLGEERRLSRADEPRELGQLGGEGDESRRGGAQRLGVDGDRAAAADVELAAHRQSHEFCDRDARPRAARSRPARPRRAARAPRRPRRAARRARRTPARPASASRSRPRAGARAAAASARRSATRRSWSAARSIAASADGRRRGQAGELGRHPPTLVADRRRATRRPATSGDERASAPGWGGGGRDASWAGRARRDRMERHDRRRPTRALPRRVRLHRQHLPVADGAGRVPGVRGCRGPRRRASSRRAPAPATGTSANPPTSARSTLCERRGYDGTQAPRAPVHARRLRPQRPRRRARPQPRAHPARLGAQPSRMPTRSRCCMSFDPSAHTLDVPDPYYAGPGMFDEVLGMIESASRSLFRQLEPAIRPAM